MKDFIPDPAKFYRVVFVDGQAIDFKIKSIGDNDSILCEKKGGETFYLDTMVPFEKIIEIDSL